MSTAHCSPRWPDQPRSLACLLLSTLAWPLHSTLAAPLEERAHIRGARIWRRPCALLVKLRSHQQLTVRGRLGSPQTFRWSHCVTPSRTQPSQSPQRLSRNALAGGSDVVRARRAATICSQGRRRTEATGTSGEGVEDSFSAQLPAQPSRHPHATTAACGVKHRVPGGHIGVHQQCTTTGLESCTRPERGEDGAYAARPRIGSR